MQLNNPYLKTCDFSAFSKLYCLSNMRTIILYHLAVLLSAVMSWSGCVVSMTPSRPHTCPPAFLCRQLTSLVSLSAFRLLNCVGEGDISSLGCGLTGSCSSTFQCYSLGDHLSVTASPQSPLPAGYVTLLVNSRSPPLGLKLFHSEEPGILGPPFSLHSKDTHLS